MLKSTQRFRREIGEFVCSGSAPATRIKRPLDPLRLPASASVPAQLQNNAGKTQNLSRMALALYNQGFLNETDEGDTKALVRTGLDRLVTGTVGTPKYVSSIHLSVACSMESVMGYPSNEESESDFWLAVELSNDAEPAYVSDKVLALETKVKGLGQMTMRALTEASWRTFDSWSPVRARDEAVSLWWWGAETKEEWEAEADAMEMDAEEREERLSPDLYDQSFPSWVLNPGKGFSLRRLSALKKHPDRQVSEVATIILEVLNLGKENVNLPTPELAELEPVYRGAFVRWNDSDPISQVADDYVNRANECCDEFTEISSLWTIPAEVADCEKWVKELHLGLTLYQKLDELLCSLTTPN